MGAEDERAMEWIVGFAARKSDGTGLRTLQTRVVYPVVDAAVASTGVASNTVTAVAFVSHRRGLFGNALLATMSFRSPLIHHVDSLVK